MSQRDEGTLGASEVLGALGAFLVVGATRDLADISHYGWEWLGTLADPTDAIALPPKSVLEWRLWGIGLSQLLAIGILERGQSSRDRKAALLGVFTAGIATTLHLVAQGLTSRHDLGDLAWSGLFFVLVYLTVLGVPVLPVRRRRVSLSVALDVLQERAQLLLWGAGMGLAVGACRQAVSAVLGTPVIDQPSVPNPEPYVILAYAAVALSWSPGRGVRAPQSLTSAVGVVGTLSLAAAAYGVFNAQGDALPSAAAHGLAGVGSLGALAVVQTSEERRIPGLMLGLFASAAALLPTAAMNTAHVADALVCTSGLLLPALAWRGPGNAGQADW